MSAANLYYGARMCLAGARDTTCPFEALTYLIWAAEWREAARRARRMA